MSNQNEKLLIAGGVATAFALGYLFHSFTSGKAAEPAKKSIYERLGGEPAIQATIDIAIPSLRRDPLLADFFTTMPEEYHKRMQFKFFTTALGGPKLYDGKSMKEAHKGKGIEKKHFDCVVHHVVKALQ